MTLLMLLGTLIACKMDFLVKTGIEMEKCPEMLNNVIHAVNIVKR